MTAPPASVLARSGISQSTTAPWTTAEDARVYGEAGVSAIGVWLHKLERGTMDTFCFPDELLPWETVDAAAAAIGQAGLGVSHVLLAGRFTEEDEEVRARRIRYALFAAEAARRLGAACLVIIPGRRNGIASRRAFELSASALDEVLARTEAIGVRLALEPVTEVDFCQTLGEALELVDAVDHPRLGVFPDSFHLAPDSGVADELARAGGRIYGVHLADGSSRLGDRQRLPPGEGSLPLVDFVRAIDATGYLGSYDVELFGIGLSSPQVTELLERSLVGLCAVLAEAL